MISGAEAGRIGRALESVAGWTSELIVVLNDDVQDGTEAIARAAGATVIREPWKGYVAQKNSALAKASQPWVLGLDADEAVSPELREEMRRALADPAAAAQINAFEFPRRTFYCGRWIRHGDWYPDRGIRLWRKGCAHWEGIDPHDKLVVQGAVARLRADLLHYSYENINRHLSKIGPYADYFARRYAERNRRATWFDLTVRPIWRFIRGYVFRLGFLDGWPGYYIAWTAAFSALTRYAKVRELEIPPSKPK